jgi:methionyl-tRNA synthetase
MFDLISQNPFPFTLVLVWTLAWKGVALWTAAKADSKKWFVALLVINTMGLLEILYIYCFSKKCCCAAQEK